MGREQELLALGAVWAVLPSQLRGVEPSLLRVGSWAPDLQASPD
jgi:hypothetical protein